MTSCALPGGQPTTFTYGADGLRRTMTTTGMETRYVYDGSMLVRQFQVDHNAGTGPTLSATYFQGLNGPAYFRNDLTGGSVAHWYVYNGLGSVVGEVDPAGNYFANGEYDVYGAPRGSTVSGSFDTRQRFVGQLGHQTDAETGGLVYMQARYYDSATGRFVSEDPGREGTNWFAYCNADPVNVVDSNGRLGRFLTEVLGMIKGTDAFLWACMFAVFSEIAAMAAGNRFYKLIQRMGYFGLALLFGEASVVCFAIALGVNPAELTVAIVTSVLGIVVAVAREEGDAAQVGAGANAIADAAVVACGAYCLAVAGALLLDSCSEI